MTISELASITKLTNEVVIPTSIENLEVINEREFPRHKIRNYLKSLVFQEDLKEISKLLTSGLLYMTLDYFGLILKTDVKSDIHISLIIK